MPGRQFPAVEDMLRDAAEDLLAFAAFPVAGWNKIWSINPLERLNKAIKRRTDVVGPSYTITRDATSRLRDIGTAVLRRGHG
jgi:transposase-like protein